MSFADLVHIRRQSLDVVLSVSRAGCLEVNVLVGRLLLSDRVYSPSVN